MKKREILALIKKYDTENYLFDVVGKNIRKKGYLTFDEFYAIAMWKSPRQKQKYLLNKRLVTPKTKAAFNLKDEKSRMLKLCELEGVAIPTASAILSVVFPEDYAIMDIRCLNALRDMGYDISTYPRINTWLLYIEIMKSIAGKYDKITPRDIDKALFAKHRIEQGENNLYPY